MSKNNILVSIIIPTKNRHYQLMETLRAHKFWPLDLRSKIEIVISDNSINRLNQEELLNIQNLFPNVNYSHITEDFTISDNFNHGYKMSTGKWIVFIGDDDFFMPSIIKTIEEFDGEDIDSIIYNPHKYYWESCKFKNSNVYGAPSTLVLSKPWANEKINPKFEFIKSLKNGGLTIEKMPRAYHGLILRDVFSKFCIHKDGQFYLGSPDISMTTMLTLKGIKIQSVTVSLTVYGASDGSAGGMTTSKSHMQALDRTLFLSKKFRDTWHKTIPKYWSEFTVFPASILYIKNEYNLKLPAKLNYATVYITCLLNEFENRKLVYDAFKTLKFQDKLNLFVCLPKAILRKSIGILFRKIKSKLHKDKLIYLKPEEIIRYDI
jgi:glycosyltransferase involved in cell wall biosynthesis